MARAKRAAAIDKARYPKDETPVFNLEIAQKVFFDTAHRSFQPNADDKNRKIWSACTMTAEEQKNVRKRAARKGS